MEIRIAILDHYNIVVETELHDAMANVEGQFTQFDKTAVAQAATNNGVEKFLIPIEPTPSTESKPAQKLSQSRKKR